MTTLKELKSREVKEVDLMTSQIEGYYTPRKEKLLGDFDASCVSVRASLVARYGQEFANVLEGEGRRQLEELIPEIPYIRGPRARTLNTLQGGQTTPCCGRSYFAPLMPTYAGELQKKLPSDIKEGDKCEMSQPQEKFEGQKARIITQIAELSQLLGMIPSDDTILIHETLTQNKMVLSDWLSATRDSFLKLSLLVSRELDIQVQ
jgi:hypothetical protein